MIKGNMHKLKQYIKNAGYILEKKIEVPILYIVVADIHTLFYLFCSFTHILEENVTHGKVHITYLKAGS